MHSLKKNFWNKKKVLITGHTGFKGRWLSVFLETLGARVHGLSIKSNNKKIFYTLLNKNYYCDIKNFNKLKKIVNRIQPEIIFHLAAQSLVLPGYKKVLDTYSTNFMGSVNLLEIAKYSKKTKAILITTTDKVYKNYKNNIEFNEKSELGGKDPYSASKAALEVAIQSFIKISSYREIKIASLRAGNVIGGGDYAKNRIMTDLINFELKNKNKIEIRNPDSVRPWQYVLDVVSGYITLAENLYKSEKFIGSYNFGPDQRLKKVKVKEVVEIFKNLTETNKNKIIFHKNNLSNSKEEKTIYLNNKKVRKILGVKNKITNPKELISRSLGIYRELSITNSKNIKNVYLKEINKYINE
tara:strand:+ start:7993 stop:9057 length:1065 start_codon:yes stop_codon:yes gene_type:complete